MRSELPDAFWAANRDFAQYPLVEIGWGDEGFYMAERITVPIACKAVFWPTPTVLHVVGLSGPPEEEFPESTVVELKLSERGLSNLVQFIDVSRARDPHGHSMALGRGLYGDSEFFRANGSYYFPRTCNWWTASALRSAGCPVRPICSVTATCFMFQVKRFGRVAQRGEPQSKTR